MTASPIPHPPVVSRDEWLVERKTLLAHEKEASFRAISHCRPGASCGT